ncbi:MAG: HAD hydrolase-like protein [Notoacmeibacter sp.]
MLPPIAVFDLDGTLVHTAPDLVASLNHALRLHEFEAAPYFELAQFAGTGGRGMLGQYCLARNLMMDESQILDIISDFLEHYQSTMPGQSTIYEGVMEFIGALRQAGYKTAVCTNKPQKLADLLLAKLGISHNFDAICGADYFDFRKPDPRHLTGTIDVAGGNPARALMFGDSQADFDVSNAAGIPVVGVTFGYSPVPIETFGPTHVISHYNQLDVGLIDKMTGS